MSVSGLIKAIDVNLSLTARVCDCVVLTSNGDCDDRSTVLFYHYLLNDNSNNQRFQCD